MAEDRFYNRYPCIVITAKGQPDVATRMFLSRLTNELKIPVMGLFDADPVSEVGTGIVNGSVETWDEFL